MKETFVVRYTDAGISPVSFNSVRAKWFDFPGRTGRVPTWPGEEPAPHRTELR